MPISNVEFIEKLHTVVEHFNNFLKYSDNKKPEQSSYFEFGSGYDLVIPIAIKLLGFNSLTCIDIRELVFLELINNTINRFSELKDRIPFHYTIPENIASLSKLNYKQVLKENFSIDYLAPVDARATGLISSSIDFILSNATMEHIPKIHIMDILIECYRLMKPGSIMSNAIDYRDHWSFFDKNISCYNFLQYSPGQWEKLNPSIMYQNRMRHREYIEIINHTNFEILEERIVFPEKHEIDQLKKINLDPYYKNNFNFEEISIKSSYLVLRKN
ncbi:MAG: class I SAM-dependent methyltransferase [Ignavibacteria bacterium]